MAVTSGNVTGPKALEKVQRTPSEAQAERATVGEFLVGYAAIFVVLTLGTESPKTSGLAAAFAVAIATGSVVLYLSKSLENLGLASPASMAK